MANNIKKEIIKHYFEDLKYIWIYFYHVIHILLALI